MKRLIQNSILLVMAIALIAGILWARYKSQGEVCESVAVEVINADSTSFVTPEGVLSDLEHQGLKFVGKRMADIQASDVEEILGNSPYLEFADIVKCQDGRLLIRVSQLLPVLRVFDGENSYYVNRAGKRMDASVYYHTMYSACSLQLRCQTFDCLQRVSFGCCSKSAGHGNNQLKTYNCCPTSPYFDKTE